MTVTVDGFLAANTMFSGRRGAPVEQAIAEASKMFDPAVCGELYDNLVEAQTRVILLRDPSGLPTSTTGDKSGLAEDAEKRLLHLKRLVPIRGLGTKGC